MATRTRKPDPTAMFVAWTSASAEVDGTPLDVARGAMLRGDHPAVQHLGALAFVSADKPENEWPTPFDREIAEAEAAAVAKPSPAPPAPRIDDATKVADLVVCQTEVLASAAGPVAVGQVFRLDDPHVAAAPAAFVPLARELEGR